uniref:Uncharacterized protein n=1 Tax=Arundo donax TaxID=35708 RepID=A0A0A8XW87_ARUDO
MLKWYQCCACCLCTSCTDVPSSDRQCNVFDSLSLQVRTSASW